MGNIMEYDYNIRCAAALMSHICLGFESPSGEIIEDLLKKGHSWDLRKFVEEISGHLFESEQEHIFFEEASDWLDFYEKQKLDLIK